MTCSKIYDLINQYFLKIIFLLLLNLLLPELLLQEPQLLQLFAVWPQPLLQVVVTG